MGSGNLTAEILSKATWKKGSHSGPEGGDCIEVARIPPGTVAVRDSKNLLGPALAFTYDEWTAFLGVLKEGT
jgi:hypothetical protein